MGDVIWVSRDQLLERLAKIDALLDIMEEYDEDTLRCEREEIHFLLGD